MKEIRCPKCRKLLLKAEGTGRLEIKCPFCRGRDRPIYQIEMRSEK